MRRKNSSTEIWKPLGPGKGATAAEIQDVHDSCACHDLALSDAAGRGPHALPRWVLAPTVVCLGATLSLPHLGWGAKVGAALLCSSLPLDPALTPVPLVAQQDPGGNSTFLSPWAVLWLLAR